MTTTTSSAAAATIPEKRRALGRGLESLLPAGPRAVNAAAAAVPLDKHDGGTPTEAEIAGEAPSAFAQGGPAPQGTVIEEIHAQAARTRVSVDSAQGRSAPHVSSSLESVVEVPLDRIVENPYQTRRTFDEDALIDLTESIKVNGVVQPIVVRRKGERYVLVLGERRLRAAKRAGRTAIPAIVRALSDQQAAETTLVENLQREDLNCLEQAAAFAMLSREFGLTQEQIGDRVGLSRESVSNHMRLLKLPVQVLTYLRQGDLGFSEARELMALPDDATIEKIAVEAVEKHWSYFLLVEAIEAITMKSDLRPPQEAGRARWVDPNVRAAQRELEGILGVRVRIKDRKGKGKIVIEYASLEDYDRVVGMLKGKARNGATGMGEMPD